MTAKNVLVRRISQVALLLVLLSLSAYLMLRTYLDDEEQRFNDGTVTEVVGRGPVEIGHIKWKIDSMQAYTKLVDDQNEPIDLDVPAGATIVLVKISITPLDGLRINNGFHCEAMLRDDRGNTWKKEDAYGLALPTFCSDGDHLIKRNHTGQIAQVYIVPKSAVPHLVGITTEYPEDFRRVLLTW
ncbi:MAG: hypothetical protein QOH50_1759 [Kribbellaceae bacterium]|jgi:hypothetical protein|nr:hypothetical protein [Kribbellaceae bacterium]